MLFERLALEINQAGLVLAHGPEKAAGVLRRFDGFEIRKVARYGRPNGRGSSPMPASSATGSRSTRSFTTPASSRGLIAEHGSLAAWLDSRHPLSKDEWVGLFKKTFRFTGGEITGEFLMSTGYLPGAHDETCPVHRRILALRPPWSVA